MTAWVGPPVLRTCPSLVGGVARGGLTTRLGFPPAGEVDPPTSRHSSREALARSLGRPVTHLAWLEQKHSAQVTLATTGGCLGDGDALVTLDPDVVPLVSVADCCPVLLWAPEGRVRAVAHAGWRGLAAGVLEATVEAMAAQGCAPGEMRGWIGPSIGPCCFEVGPEVAARFDPSCVRLTAPRPFVDLRAASLLALTRAGLDRRRVATAPDCTACRIDLYWSYRRDGGICGRHLAYLAA